MSLKVDIEGNATGFQQTLNQVKQHAKQLQNEIESGAANPGPALAS